MNVWDDDDDISETLTAEDTDATFVLILAMTLALVPWLMLGTVIIAILTS